jgi:homoserine acetyltransferase
MSFDIKGALGMETAQWESSLRNAEATAEGFKSAIEKMAAIAGISFGAEKLVEWSKRSMEASRESINMATTLDLSVSKFQAMNLAARESGSSSEAMTKGISNIRKAYGEALAGSSEWIKKLEAIGITEKDIQTIGLDGVLQKVAESFQRASTDASEYAKLTEIVGKQTKELAAGFRMMGDESGIDAYTEKMKSLGLVQTQSEAAALKETLEKLDRTLERLSTQGKKGLAHIFEGLEIGADASERKGESDLEKKIRENAKWLGGPIGAVVSAGMTAANMYSNLKGANSDEFTADHLAKQKALQQEIIDASKPEDFAKKTNADQIATLEEMKGSVKDSTDQNGDKLGEHVQAVMVQAIDDEIKKIKERDAALKNSIADQEASLLAQIGKQEDLNKMRSKEITDAEKLAMIEKQIADQKKKTAEATTMTESLRGQLIESKLEGEKQTIQEKMDAETWKEIDEWEKHEDKKEKAIAAEQKKIDDAGEGLGNIDNRKPTAMERMGGGIGMRSADPSIANAERMAKMTEKIQKATERIADIEDEWVKWVKEG